MELQATMVVLVSPHAKCSCYLIDMVNGNTKKIMLPNVPLKIFVGCSATYVILQEFNMQITLVNPLNGRELNLNAPTFILKGNSLHEHTTAILIW
jgi:hypothetical protein